MMSSRGARCGRPGVHLGAKSGCERRASTSLGFSHFGFRSAKSRKMTFKNFSLREWISVCARCKSLHSPICIFCEECWKRLFEIQNLNLLQPHYSFPVYSLFIWLDENDHLIRPLIYALKGGIIQKPWSVFAVDFLFLREQTDANALLVLPPSGNKRDHAFCWARALALQMKAEMIDVFALEGHTVFQKSLSRQERQNRKFILKEEIDRDRTFIFVDDTITSGGTAQAAFEALDCPDRFEVWTLVSKPRRGTQ